MDFLSKKRPAETSDGDRPPKKRPLLNIVTVGVADAAVYKFRILLPNGSCVGLTLREMKKQIPVEEFIFMVKNEYHRSNRQTESSKPRRKIKWESEEVCFVDEHDRRLRKIFDFGEFQPNKLHILRLSDGTREADVYENMWDLTPDIELLKELPEEYTFETALADLIDNSLQAVWKWDSKGVNHSGFISVEVTGDKISIFDNGPGMELISKWGKIGASLHRSFKGKGIGGSPPYLMPAFGMFGYGGPMASMHLGRRAEVSSKTRGSKKVYTLRLDREALLKTSGSELTWRTDGGLRDPLEDELEKSSAGSFTKVDIFGLKMSSLGISRLQCRLKDIYFPYIQCDDVSKTGKTTTPIEFQVNGINLAEVEGGEVAITNLHTCHGPEFVLQLCFRFNQDKSTRNSPGDRASQEANARLRCVYLPANEGKESIDRILEKLEAGGIIENFESFSRVCVRRLGRLLPDARWTWLPFMDLRHRKGEKAQLLKRCCMRVKCFIETDAGFNPTPSKTDLAHQNTFTIALKFFGNKQPLVKDKDVQIDIRRDGKQLTLVQLDRMYQEWVLQMHEQYDEEVASGVDEPVVIVNPSNRKELGITMSSEVVRVHKVLQRRGTFWKSGQKIKILKGACPGCHKNNVYATLEYILLEGFKGDAGGDARFICRPLSITQENGCLLESNKGNPSLILRQSICIPVSVIDSRKCVSVESDEWNNQLEKQHQKSPSSIEILSAGFCRELGFEVGLPIEAEVDAGHVPPDEVVAVVRPASFNPGSTSKDLDPKYIVKQNFEMALEVKFVAEDENLPNQTHVYSGRVNPLSRKGLHGLYVFQVKGKPQPLFQKAGLYTFSFSLREQTCRNCVKKVHVKGLPEIRKWGLRKSERISNCILRVGSYFPSFSLEAYDRYDNQIPHIKIPEIVVKVRANSSIIARVDKMNVSRSSNKLYLTVQGLLIESFELDNIRPNYEANLMIRQLHDSLSINIPFKVYPGPVERVVPQPTNFEKKFLPGHVIKELELGMFDTYGNHVKENEEIRLEVDGFYLLDKAASVWKVNNCGRIDLSGLLKVTEGYGKSVSLSVLSGKKVVFREDFQTEERELRAASRIPESCIAGSQLENVAFEVINSNGDVDDSIHDDEKVGQSHTLTIKSQSMDVDDAVKYSFRHGRCTVRSISVPENEGDFTFAVAHSRHPELQLIFKVHVEPVPEIVYQPLSSDRNSFLFPGSPVFLTPKKEYDDVHQQCSDGKALLVLDSTPSKDVEILLGSIINDEQELFNDVLHSGRSIAQHEQDLELFQTQQKAIENDLSELQASMDRVHYDMGDSLGKKAIMEKIESRSGSAAAVVCELLRVVPLKDRDKCILKHGVIGVVALLGTVQTMELSRILAEYLGDQMLAIVCNSYDDIGSLEKCDINGIVNPALGLHKYGTLLGKPIHGRFLVISLDNVRPYRGFGGDPQGKLTLPDPLTSNGTTPEGYLGYAVNLVFLDVNSLQTRTSDGDGLRETLFYHLFGELQVYKTRDDMMKATPYITQGAVSVDGGIMRGRGAISLGCWEPDVYFPVIASEPHLSRHTMKLLQVLQMVEDEGAKLRETVAEIDRVTKELEKNRKKFNKKKERADKVMNKNRALLKSLEYKPSSDSSIPLLPKP